MEGHAARRMPLTCGVPQAMPMDDEAAGERMASAACVARRTVEGPSSCYTCLEQSSALMAMVCRDSIAAVASPQSPLPAVVQERAVSTVLLCAALCGCSDDGQVPHELERAVSPVLTVQTPQQSTGRSVAEVVDSAIRLCFAVGRAAGYAHSAELLVFRRSMWLRVPKRSD